MIRTLFDPAMPKPEAGAPNPVSNLYIAGMIRVDIQSGTFSVIRPERVVILSCVSHSVSDIC